MMTSGVRREAIKSFIEYSEHHIKAEEKWVEENPNLNESATVAQAFNAYLDTYWGPLLRYGLLYRAINYEYERTHSENLRILGEEVLKRINKYLTIFESLTNYYVIPIRNLVQIQLASILSTVMSIRTEY